MTVGLLKVWWCLLVIFTTCRFADVFTGRMKLFLIFLFLGSTGSFLWFSLLCQGIIPFARSELSFLFVLLVLHCLCHSSTAILSNPINFDNDNDKTSTRTITVAITVTITITIKDITVTVTLTTTMAMFTQDRSQMIRTDYWKDHFSPHRTS